MKKKKVTLVECLLEIEDPRRGQGQRYSSISMLIIIIMAILRGNYRYREMGRFCALHSKTLIKKFGFKNNLVPSYVTIRDFIKRTDFEAVSRAFYKWSKGYVEIQENDWLSIDGKSIRSTVSDYSNEFQNFVSLVSVFSAQREQIVAVKHFENKKGCEVRCVTDLLKMLDLKGVVFTMDALHCKKNSKPNCKKQKRLCHKVKKEPTEAL